MQSDLTISELATVTGWHPESLRRLARKAQLPGAYRLGSKWMVSREAANKLRNLPPNDGSKGGSE